MPSFAAVQANATDWVIQRDDGNYLQWNGSAHCWGTAHSSRTFGPNNAEAVAYGLNNPLTTNPAAYDWSPPYRPWTDPLYNGFYAVSGSVMSTEFTLIRLADGSPRWSQEKPEGMTIVLFPFSKAVGVAWAASNPAAPAS